MKNLFVWIGLVIWILVTLSLGGCGKSMDDTNSAVQESATESNLSTALQFHIQTAADDLVNAIKDIDPTSFEANIGFVKYAQITIPQAKKLAEQEWNIEIANKLQELDDRITAVTTNPDVLVADLVMEVRFVSDLLKEIIK